MMDKYEKKCRALLGLNVKFLRNRLGLPQSDLALKLGISTIFLSDIENGKKWVSAQTLSKIAKALKIEVYELFKPEQNIKEDNAAAVAMYLDEVDATLIKSIDDAVKSAVKRSVTKMRRFYLKEQKNYLSPSST